MGNDGGTIAKRQDIISLHSGLLGNDKNITNESKDNSTLIATCAISSLPLYSKNNDPVVGDYRGKLYLKRKILENLLKQRENPELSSDSLSHIRSLNDLVNVSITWNTDGATPTVICPVSKEQQGGKNLFSYIRSCGCVLSFKLLKELSKHFGASLETPKESECPHCNKCFHFDYDVIVLNRGGDPKIDETNQQRYDYVKNKLHLTHSGKPKMKKKNGATKTNASGSKKRKTSSNPASATKLKKV